LTAKNGLEKHCYKILYIPLENAMMLKKLIVSISCIEYMWVVQLLMGVRRGERNGQLPPWKLGLRSKNF